MDLYFHCRTLVTNGDFWQEVTKKYFIMDLVIESKFIWSYITENVSLYLDRQPPKNYAPNTPLKEQAKKKLFREVDSPISESDDDNTTSETKQKKIFKFRKLDVKEEKSPSSSPLPWPPTPIVISSDEELERSMCELEEKISLEMDPD